VPAIVRVPSKDYHHIARGLDVGAEGVMLPMVNDAAEAKAIVDAVKYVPAGARGVALGIAHDGYAVPGDVMERLAEQNARTTLFAQIETEAGVNNAEAIAATDGVDCLWVGHFDLSCSLGIPGDFAHPRFAEAIATVVEACNRTGTALGRLVPTPELGVELYAGGFDFVCYAGDVWVLGAALKQGVDALRDGAANAPAAAPAAKPKRARSAPKAGSGKTAAASKTTRRRKPA
jgi:2-dehydro-3-deoxyglucarate aldolase/4-hydroxy-2-oxoheptanedioate aldolase